MEPSTHDLLAQQDVLLKEMATMRVLRRGTVSAQQYAGRRTRRAGHGAVGPYFVWQGYCGGRRFCRRVSAEEAERMRREIAVRQRFERLCAEYIRLGEVLAERPEEEALKKGQKSRSNRAKR